MSLLTKNLTNNTTKATNQYIPLQAKAQATKDSQPEKAKTWNSKATIF